MTDASWVTLKAHDTVSCTLCGPEAGEGTWQVNCSVQLSRIELTFVL